MSPRIFFTHHTFHIPSIRSGGLSESSTLHRLFHRYQILLQLKHTEVPHKCILADLAPGTSSQNLASALIEFSSQNGACHRATINIRCRFRRKSPRTIRRWLPTPRSRRNRRYRQDLAHCFGPMHWHRDLLPESLLESRGCRKSNPVGCGDRFPGRLCRYFDSPIRRMDLTIVECPIVDVAKLLQCFVYCCPCAFARRVSAALRV